MATKTAQNKRQLPFTKAGMSYFKSINEAIKYFSLPENGKRSRRSVSFLFGETFELNVGSLSINMASYLNDSKMFEKVLGDYLKSKPTLAAKVKVSVENWIKENDPKQKGVKEEATAEKQQAEQVVLIANVEPEGTV